MVDPIPADLLGISPFSDEALEPWLVQAEEGTLDEASPISYWEIQDQGGAEWAARKLAPLLAHVADAEERAKAWKAQIDAWLAAEVGADRRRATFFETHLQDWARRRREANEDDKTLHTTCVEVSTTGYQARPVIEDEATLAGWLYARGLEDALSIEVRKREFAKLVTIEEVKDEEGEQHLVAIYRSPAVEEAEGQIRYEPMPMEIPGVSVEPAGFTVGKPKLI